MDAFRAGPDGSVVTAVEPVEAALLTQLASRVAGILTAEQPDGGAARARLLPDAYRDDAEAAAEFRRFTADDLTDRKVRNAQRMIADVAAPLTADATTEVVLDEDSVGAWVRTLTDIRLVVADRLGIEHDGDTGRDDDEAFMLGDVYAWLGWVQESLVDALSRSER